MIRRVPSHLYGDFPGQLAYFTAKGAEHECWEFTGYVLPQGYGQIGRNIGAHRLAWELANGRAVPEGLVIDHTCHNADPDCNDNFECRHRRCVNPAHLEPVTGGTNVLRGKGFAPMNAAKTHCVQGHEFTPENTYMRPDRYGRICRTCRDEALRLLRPYYREQRAKQRARRRALADTG